MLLSQLEGEREGMTAEELAGVCGALSQLNCKLVLRIKCIELTSYDHHILNGGQFY